MPRTATWVLAAALLAPAACKNEDASEAFADDAAKMDDADTSDPAFDRRDEAPSLAAGTAGVTSAAMLPLFSDPVAGEAAIATTGHGISLGAQAESGAANGDGGLAEAFKRTPDASYAACETARATRAFFADLSAVDETLCEFRSVLAALGPPALDGKTHAVRLSGGDGAPDHARFRVLHAGPGASFADVAVDLCARGKQVAHARYEMTETSFVLEAKAQWSQGVLAVTAHAGLTPDGRLAGTKRISVERRDGPAAALTEATQTARELVLSRAGEVRIFADVELFDANVPGTRYALANLSLGDGAALIADGAAAVRQGWSGDTWEATEAVTQVARVQDVRDEELLQRPTGPAPAFARDEVYACDQPEDQQAGPDLDLEAAQCPDVALPQGRIDCRAATVNTAGR